MHIAATGILLSTWMSELALDRLKTKSGTIANSLVECWKNWDRIQVSSARFVRGYLAERWVFFVI